jgi:hypothetical protein
MGGTWRCLSYRHVQDGEERVCAVSSIDVAQYGRAELIIGRAFARPVLPVVAFSS